MRYGGTILGVCTQLEGDIVIEEFAFVYIVHMETKILK